MGVQLVTPESIGTFVAVAAGTTPPSSAPVLSLSSYTDTTIDVSCTSVSGATGYKFYKDGSLVATQAGTTYQYTGLTALTTYALTCKAYNGGGDSSASNTVTQRTFYPNLSDTSKQAIWIDRFRSYKDNNVTLAAAGDTVQSILLPSGWDVLSAGGSVTQSTAGNRPTYQSDGLQSNGTSSYMTLPAALALSGDYTFYWVGTRGAAGRVQMAMGTNSGAGYENIGQDYSDNVSYCTDSGNSNATGGPADNTYCIRRWRRSGSTSYYKAPGASEVSTVGGSGLITLNVILARRGQAPIVYTNTSCRLNQWVVYKANITPGSADDLKIIAALQVLESGVTGP